MSTETNLNDTLGAALVGLIVASLLHGVSVVQAWYYFMHQKDPWPLKFLVGAVTVFDTVHEILISHTVYSYAVTSWGKPDELDKIVWSMLVEVIFNGMTAFFVQSFMALRVLRLSNGNKILTGAVIVLVIAEFGCVIAFAALSLHIDTYEQLSKIKSLSILVNSIGAVGDVLIAATLCALLHFSRTGHYSSNTIINKLIFFSVSTGLLTSICAIASLISILVAGNTFIYIAFYFCIGRLYTNSLLASLNARDMIRNAGDGINNSPRLSMPNMSFSSPIPTNLRSIKVEPSKELSINHDPDQNPDLNDIDKAEIKQT